MATTQIQAEAAPSKATAIAKLKLPHPYLTTYFVVPANDLPRDWNLLRIHASQDETNFATASELNLHNDQLYFTVAKPPTGEGIPPLSNNTAWARCQRAPGSVLEWSSEIQPTLSQIWLVVYSMLTMQPELEIFRWQLNGTGSFDLAQQIRDSMLGYQLPESSEGESTAENVVVISRSAFWQGAASPFGGRTPWTPSSRSNVNAEPVDRIITTGFPSARVHQLHPRRPAKPQPGSVVYSRYLPTLDEHFSLIALDYRNDEHLRLFHTWQNDPRVAKGWNETGTLEQHRDYLRRQHEDPHTLAVLGRFNETCFSYFEIYWCKEDHVGAHYNSGDWDRGRHSLVGDARYRGRHRVLGWWSCIIHFIFCDDHRTDAVIGEPVATNNTVMIYDYMHGLNVEKVIDFPHKRAALVKVTRERFFQLCPLYQTGGFIAGTGVPLPARM